MPRCPQCGNDGRKVRRVTLESLLRAERRVDIGDGPYHVCLTPDCETVYFGADDTPTFVKSDLSVRFGLKETAPPRPLCYCFDHSIEGIHGEIRLTGRSTVLDSIKSTLKVPGCRCEYTNPLGGCCLASVQDAVTKGFELVGGEDRAVVCNVGDREGCCVSDAAQAGLADEVHEDCCLETPDAYGVEATRRRTGVVAASGSVLAAILSSACCWLPLLLIAFGVSAAGVAGFFEAYRPYFITGAMVMLGIGFYTVYFRREKCAPDSACAAPNRRLGAFSRVMLWTATALVGAAVFFPDYVGYLFAAPTAQTAPEVPQDRARLTTVRVHVEGMTCAGCATGLRAALEKLSGVASVAVDYSTRIAEVCFEADAPHAPDDVIEVVETAGYRATLAKIP